MTGFLRVTIGLSTLVQGLFVAHIAFPDTQQNHTPFIHENSVGFSFMILIFCLLFLMLFSH